MKISLEAGKLKFAVSTGKSVNQTELGASGTTIWSGMVQEEYLSDLKGSTGITTYDKMRKSDGMVQAMLLALELPLRSAEWYIKPAEDEPNAEKIGDFLKEALFERMSITFDDFLQHVLLLNLFGFSIFEKVYKIEDGQIYWKKLAPRLPKTLNKWKLDDEGGLAGIQQYVLKADKYQYIDIPVEKLLVFTRKKEGSNYEGISVLRTAYKHWYIKDALYKIANIGLERQAIGVSVGKLAEGYSPEDKTAMEDIVEKLKANEEMGVTLPPGFDLTILEGKIKSAELLEHIKHHDTKMAQSILAQFLQLGQEGQGGSYSLSKDQSDFFLMSLLACGNSICDTINRYAVPQLIDYNFTVKKYPQLAMKLSTIDVGKLTEGLSKLVTGKVVLPDDELEDFIRDLLGLPAVAEEREVREVSTTPALLFEKAKTEEKAKKFTEKKGKFRRQLTKYEQGVRFQEIEDRFDKAEEALKKAMLEIMLMQRDDLLDQIIRYIESGRLQDLYQVTVRLRGKYSETLRGYLKELVAFGKEMVEAEHKLPAGAISQELTRWLGIKADTLTELHAAKMKATAMLTTLNSLNAGKSDKAIIFDVKEAISVWADRELTGTVGATVVEAVNEGRQMVGYQHKELFQAAQYSAILDVVTCPLCEGLDGSVIDLDSPDYERFTPPLHFNCRCIWVMIEKEEVGVEYDWETPSKSEIERHGGLIA